MPKLPVDGQVICLICGVSRRELNGHLRMHDLTAAEYKARFPGAITISPQSARRKREGLQAAIARNGREPPSNETRRKIAASSRRMHEQKKAELGAAWTDQLRLFAANARAAKGSDYRHSEATLSKMRRPHPSMQGVPKSEETKRKLSELRKGRKNGPHKPSTIQKMRDAWKLRKADTKAFEQYRADVSARMSSPEAIVELRRRISVMIRNGNHNGRSKDTALEKRFARFLSLNEIEYDPQYILDTDRGTFTFDFYIAELNLLVEVDGEYWHRKSLEVWNRDRLKQALAKEAGFIVARISDRAWTPQIIFAEAKVIQEHSDSILDDRRVYLTALKEPPN